ncbi:MAG: hypothetical protein JWM10_1435 [Myxococcaceae bacterium]|nr:hypothetical protein [Myxococcaceae bacterium]
MVPALLPSFSVERHVAERGTDLPRPVAGGRTSGLDEINAAAWGGLPTGAVGPYASRVSQLDQASGRRLFDAIDRVLGDESLTIEEVARRVGCSPHDVLEALRRFDRTSRISLVPGADAAVVVRSMG